MRGKVAKALRRAAFKFSVENSRQPKMRHDEFKRTEIRWNGSAFAPFTIINITSRWVDGLRYFYRRLKKGYMQGKVTS
jgi:hypothetical protein